MLRTGDQAWVCAGDSGNDAAWSQGNSGERMFLQSVAEHQIQPHEKVNHVPLTSAIGPSSYLHCHTLSLLTCQVLMAQDITLAHSHSCRASKPCLRSSGLAPNPMMMREL